MAGIADSTATATALLLKWGQGDEGSDRGYLNTFDITPDGKHLVFDRSRQNSDVVLIDLPQK